RHFEYLNTTQQPHHHHYRHRIHTAKTQQQSLPVSNYTTATNKHCIAFDFTHYFTATIIARVCISMPAKRVSPYVNMHSDQVNYSPTTLDERPAPPPVRRLTMFSRHRKQRGCLSWRCGTNRLSIRQTCWLE